MNGRPDVGTIATTVVAGAGAEVLWNQVGVVLVGALGGAFWAVMRSDEAHGWAESLRRMAPRAVLSFCLSWGPALALESWLTNHAYEVPLTAAMLAVAFAMACPKELFTELRPILKYLPKAKD